jgi:hypothetical protein
MIYMNQTNDRWVLGNKILPFFDRAGFTGEVMFFMGGVFGLILSRTHTQAVLIFAIFYFLLVYRTCLTRSLCSLALCGLLSSLILALRFKYLTWGDPWFEYAMIMNIMKNGMLSPAYYPDQEPALHTLIAVTSTYINIGAMALQKFIVPALSALTPLALYSIASEFFDKETAIISALLLSVGTAYIHWTSQAVTESIGIPMAVIALYFSYKSLQNIRHLLAACIVIIGLVLTHHLSTLIFIVWYNSFVLAHLYFRSVDGMQSLRGLFISVFSLVAAFGWWSVRMPKIYNQVINTIGMLFHTSSPIYYILLILIIIYSAPALLSKQLTSMRSRVVFLQEFRTAVYLGIILCCVVCTLLALNFLMGKSFFVLNYPILFFANGLMMLLFALFGMRSFLCLDKTPVLAWAGGVALLFVGSILKLYYAEDPLRFVEFIYPPLSIIAACGFIIMTSKLGSRCKAALMALICLSSLVAAFPSTVFFGQDYSSMDPSHDLRAFVINHPESELMAIDHLKDHNARGVLHTDRYVSYASLQLENVTSDTSIPLLEGIYDKNGRQQMNPDSFSGDSNFVIITSRMTSYAEFGEWLLQEKSPLTTDEWENIERKTSLIYDNGDAWIYRGSRSKNLEIMLPGEKSHE